MKIDLRKDKGILGPNPFSTELGSADDFDQSEEERIAEVMRRRLSGSSDESEETPLEVPSHRLPPKKVKADSNRNPLRELVLVIIMIAVTLYFLHDRGLLQPYEIIIKSYWAKLVGSAQTSDDLTTDATETMEDGVLPDELFNELMPMTEDIAALADSLGDTYLAGAFDSAGIGTADTTEAYTPIAEEPIQLSDDDILIINNRSLLLMVIELIGIYPPAVGEAHLFLKRDGFTMTAARGGEWVPAMKKVLDKFVFGSFKENYSAGNAKVSSKFEIIMNAERDFQAQDLDALRLLDVLAHPFNDYLQQIVIDLSRGTDDNPASFSFAGTPQEIQYVLSSWAESRCNYRLRSVDIDFKAKEISVTLDVEFFNYRP